MASYKIFYGNVRYLDTDLSFKQDVLINIDANSGIASVCEFESIKCGSSTDDQEICRILQHKFVAELIKLCMIGTNNLNPCEIELLSKYNKYVDLSAFIKSLSISEIRTCTLVSYYPKIVVQFTDKSREEFDTCNVVHSVYTIPQSGHAEIVVTTKDAVKSISYCRRIAHSIIL